MAKITANKKQQRKERIILVVQRHPNGVTEAELEEDTGIQRRTINNYLRELEREGWVYKEEQSTLWFPLRPLQMKLAKFDLSPEEVMTLYLAMRLLAKQQDKRNEAAETALIKLAHILTSGAGIGKEIEEAAREIARRREDKGYEPIFQRMMQGYIYRRRMKIVYEPLVGKPFETIFSTYLIEPSAIGYTTYAIGHSSVVNDLRSFKLERIQSAEFTRDEYAIPPDFPGLDILTNAWSIFSGDKTERVELRFRGERVIKRVLETNWHASQEHEYDEDGSLLWKVNIADTTDIEPWIRSWGADVIVLAPDTLRDSVIQHVGRSVGNYRIKADNRNMRLLALWGKTSNQEDLYHPAIYHMLDVAHVAQHLLSHRVNSRWRNVLGTVLNVEPSGLIEWLPWIVALHDIGKLSVPFQALNETQRTRLEEEGWHFGNYGAEYKMHHTMAGRLVLNDWAKNTFGRNRRWRQIVLDMVSGHHGVYQKPESEEYRQWASLDEPPEWDSVRLEAISFLQSLLLINPPSTWPNPDNVSAAITALNGFVILCDWLGSDEGYFKPRPLMEPVKYVKHSKEQAQKRVADAGFFVPTLSQAPTDFVSLFGWNPRPLQRAIDQIPDNVLGQPSLTIIESLTGEGKTEAALSLAHRIGQLRDTDELYIALPTTATSNAMFQRLQEHLRDRLQLPTEVSLIHGQAFLVEDDLRIDPLDNGDGEPHRSLEWFAPKKRALLAPFGVGTVDQAELAALNVKHNALRLIGLAGKVVILDEVHAYDTYMTTIIQAMLEWLSALGTSVILLSATLPLAKRQQLVRAYTGQEIQTTNEAYPYLLTVSQAGSYEDNPPPAQASRVIELDTLHFGEDESVTKAEWLLSKIENGGTAVWITNTVNRSQDLFQALQAIAPADVDLLLLHARFPLNRRQEIETAVLDRYGKEENGRRPQKGIVVGTQVLEQSLDLDFDLMVSDLAPVDLLLQRAGRLHRHPERTNRSAHHPTPRLFINAEVDEDGSLIIGADKFYTEYILLKSWEAIQGKVNATGGLSLPQDYRPLIEHVYHDEEPPTDSLFRTAWEKRNEIEVAYEGEATLRLAGKPDPRRPFWQNASTTFEENEDSAAWINAQTRYIERDTITVIPLEKLPTNQVRLINANLVLDTARACNRESQLVMLQHSVRINKPAVVNELVMQPPTPLFAESGLLKRCYPLFMRFDEAHHCWVSDGLQQVVTFNNTVGIAFLRQEN